VVSDSAEVIASGDRVQVQGDQGSREPTLPSVPALPGVCIPITGEPSRSQHKVCSLSPSEAYMCIFDVLVMAKCILEVLRTLA
jgi:hypothetical protein